MAGPRFYDLLHRRRPQHFIAFDLLWLDGRDLRRLPLVERKTALRRLVVPNSTVRLSDDFDSELFRTVCEMDLEGIVAKRKDGLYTPEQTTWVKIKNPRYSQAEGRSELFEKRRSGAGSTR